MDTTRQAIEDADLSKLNDKDKGELRQFLALESKRSEVQASTSCFPFPSTSNANWVLVLVGGPRTL